MAKINPPTEPKLPFNGENGLSERSLVPISQALHEEIWQRARAELRNDLVRIRRKDLVRLVDGTPVLVTTKSQVHIDMIIVGVDSKEAEVKLCLPLRGEEASVQRVLQELVASVGLRVLRAEKAGLVGWVTLPQGAGLIGFPFADGKVRPVCMTQKEIAERGLKALGT